MRFRKNGFGALIVLGILLTLTTACGGGGGGGGAVIPPGLVAAFAGGNPTPGAMTINMTSGPSNGSTFSILVNVTGIPDFFGAAFRVTFNGATASLAGSSAAGSFIDVGGATVNFNAVESTPGTVLVNATRQGMVAGVSPAATDLLITLTFNADAATGGNVFTFGTAADREVRTCATANGVCPALNDNMLTWSGGTMVAN
ncbi:MAG: cohesin domain-containing protein [Acidobacteriota bacterium]|nr:cohesin domain-containing protein [Acidobacteriota bacterium]